MKYKKNDEIYINENKMVELIFFYICLMRLSRLD